MGAEPSAWRLGQSGANTDEERRDAAAYVRRHATSTDDEQHLLNTLGLTDTRKDDDRAH